jgi:ribosomal protein L7/L12
MAETRCPRCTEELSDKVAICPHCGYALHGPTADSRELGEIASSQSASIGAQSPDADERRSEIKKEETTEPVPVQPTLSREEEFRRIHAEAGPIQAIKYWREVTGSSLADAKAFYDQEKAAGRLGTPAPHPKRKGCLKALFVLIAIVAVIAGVILIQFSCGQPGTYSTGSHHGHSRRMHHHH